MATLLLVSLTFLSLLSLSSPLPSQTVFDATELLSNSGFTSMAFTLGLVSSETSIAQYPSATVFSPPDAAFFRSGQPSLSLLQFHFSPLPISPETLKSLSFGTKIPTMFPGHSLVVTTSKSDDQISFNNVQINRSPIYDDGSLIIFGIEDFFHLDFQVSAAAAPAQSPRFGINQGCLGSMMDSSGAYSFHEASGVLRSRGYSVMASFLDLQLLGFRDDTRLTVFAPVDEAMATHVGNYSEYSSIFLRHLVPCKLMWNDLVNFDDKTEVQTYLEGFTINIARSGNLLLLNDAAVTFQDMYYSDWLVVHGLREIISLEQVVESESENGEF